eukprot:10538404-Ditylum_brightwellii.AAC.1
MECFDFQDAGNKPAGNYQRTTLHMIFGCKQDLRRKAKLVAGGHLIDLLEKRNAYVNAHKTEKVYAVAGPEFGKDLIRKIVMIRTA